MASITIRNLPDNIKEELRYYSAKMGCSMEEAARQILAKSLIIPQQHSQDLASFSCREDRQNKNNTKRKASSAVQDFLTLQDKKTHQDKKATQDKNAPHDKNIVLIIGAGIAAYKSLDLIRRLKESCANIHVVMTESAKQFITPLSAGALSGNRVHTDLFSQDSEHDIGHIKLARQADIVIVAPATASRMAKMAHGLADDLAGAILLATDAPIVLAPAMNPYMYQNPANTRNIATLKAMGCHFIGPNYGEMAESHEQGLGRMSEPLEIVALIEDMLQTTHNCLKGKHIVVTSGPTHEPIDPVRYIANHSSGKQGHAIAKALYALGAKVTLISGPVHINDPIGVDVIHVKTALEMQKAVEAAMPADVGVFVAAVADWRSENYAVQKIKKSDDKAMSNLKMVENPDILATIGKSSLRPKLLIGFAAETHDLLENGQKKLNKKGVDYIIVNNVSEGENVMGGDENTVHIIGHDKIIDWPKMSKTELAKKLALFIAEKI